MRHIFYFPASYLALLYGFVTAAGLLCSLFIGLSLHSKEILNTACGEDHYEFWPSISSTIGDMLPERQTWRIAFILCTPFRIGATISLFNVYWQKSSRGMADLYSFRSSWRAFLNSNAFLSLLLLWVDIWRLISACIWAMVASFESLSYHNLGFCPYVFFCFVLQIVATALVRRNRFNMAIYPTQQDANTSLLIKRICVWGEGIASLGVVFGFAYHFTTCANGSFSISNMFEWLFATCNIGFDASAWYDMKEEGWWLSGTPSFYRNRWGRRGGVHSPTRSVDMMQKVTNGLYEVADNVVVMPSVSPDGNSISHSGAYGSLDADLSEGREGAEETVALSSSPRLTTGEYFLDHDVILHRFTFCCAPSRLMLWLCDIYFAHLIFEMVVHLVEHMYFMPLIAMSLSWEVSTVLVIGAPCLLRIGKIRRWATGPCPFAKSWLKPAHVPIGLSHRVVPMYVLFYALSCFSHFHHLVRHDPGRKILVVAIGPLFLYLGVFSRFLYPSTVTLKRLWSEGNEDSRRTTMAIPLGLVLCMLLRILHVGLSPFYTQPFYGAIFGVTLGLVFTTVIYRHAMFGNTLKEEEQQQQQQQRGVNGSANVSGIARTVTRDAESEEQHPDVDDEKKDATADGVRVRGVHFSLSQIEEVNDNTISTIASLYPAPPPMVLGILLGAITSIGVTFFNSANYIPRLLALNPYPANFMVVGIFVCGIYYSMDVLPITLTLLRPKRRPDAIRRLLHTVFRGSWARFGVLLFFSTLLMLFGTRQTNFSYELQHPGYPVTMDSPKSDVDVKFWAAEESFAGSKRLAFVGGLGFTFCIAVLFPFTMEVTWNHQRDRRLAQIAEAMDVEAVITKECSFFTSFELAWTTTVISLCALYALSISYPFVPMAWLVREKSRPLILVHVTVLYLSAYFVASRIRGSRSVAAAIVDITTARKQRSMQLMVLILVLFAFVWVFFGYISMGGNEGFAANKKTAIEYTEDVLRVHEMLLELRRERNNVTDPLAREFEVTYYKTRFEAAVEKMGNNITRASTENPVDPRYQLGHLSAADRVDVWNAAQAMTLFSGAIFTVHFGLDNYNVDSFSRMVEHLRSTEASVIGLLESDSMHLTNGNRDLVDYVSYHLGFPYTDYGPTALDNTYGCALITRYPIMEVHRYVLPSPLGELACTIHAVLDVYGIRVHTYVGHFGNTEHWADGLLQSQFLGRLVQANPGPSMWLGYLVTPPGHKERYQYYSDPKAPGMFRDAGLEMYRDHPWERLWDRGGYEETPPVTVTTTPGENVDFNVEYKLPLVEYLEEGLTVDDRFRRLPPGKPLRYFYYKDTRRFTTAHPRFEFIDRYCQYILYKRGTAADEKPENAGKLQKMQLRLFDWWRIVDHGVEELSDTEIQVVQFAFEKQMD